MKSIDENNRILENMELLLKSIDYQLGRLLQILSMPMEKEEKKEHVTGGKVPEMVTIKEASIRTGLSYDFLRKQCLKDSLAHIRVGNGKFLINFDLLVEQMSTIRGVRKEENCDGI